MPAAYINRIATAIPPNEVHNAFVKFTKPLLADPRERGIFERLVERGQIEKRWSCLIPAPDCRSASIDGERFYSPGGFPSTGQRMRNYEREAPALAEAAVTNLDLGAKLTDITHLIVTSCTGFSAPGLDLHLIHRFGLDPGVERTIIGFMGCYAAINGLKAARHIVRSEPEAKVLLVSIELCTLHFQETHKLDLLMPFLLFADGCAAVLISAVPEGLELESFYAHIMPEAADQMAWYIRDLGFDMVLSSKIPLSVARAIKASSERILRGSKCGEIDMWAVHPGGRAILDSVEAAFALPGHALDASRRVLRDFGNMSSATVLFVLKALLDEGKKGARGCAMSFGPGLTAETMLFRSAS